MTINKSIRVITGSDAFQLTSTLNNKKTLNTDLDGREFRLTITIKCDEALTYRQRHGRAFLRFNFAKNTDEVLKEIPGVSQNMEPITLILVALGDVSIYYSGKAKLNVWLSYYAEYIE